MTKQTQQQNGELRGRTLWNVYASVTNLTFRFASAVLVARMLGAEATGSLAFNLWAVEIGVLVFGGGVRNTLVRFVAECRGRDAHGEAEAIERWAYYRAVKLAPVGAAIVFTVGIFGVYGMPIRSMSLLMAALFTTQLIGSFYQAELIGNQRFKRLASLNGSAGIALLAGVAVGTKLESRVLVTAAYCCSQALICAPLLVRHWKPVPMSLSKRTMRRLKRFSWNSWVAALLTGLVWSRTELVFLKLYSGFQELAIFTISVSIAGLITQFSTMLCGALMPHFAALHGKGDETRIRSVYAESTWLLALAIFPICTVAAGATGSLIPLIYGPGYDDAVPYAAALICAAALGFAGAGSSLVYGMERSGFVLGCNAVGTCVSVAACYCLVPNFGVAGAVASRILVQSGIVIAGMVYIFGILGFRIPGRLVARAALASLAGGVCTFFLVSKHIGVVGLLLAVGFGLLVCGAGCLFLKAVSRSDIRNFKSLPSKAAGRVLAKQGA